MSRMSRTKGQVGEREVAAELSKLTGQHVTRRVRNAAGDADLEGLKGWAVEVKRHRSASRADLKNWWQQALKQSQGLRPLLLYRKDRDEWRAVWLGATHGSDEEKHYEHTVESNLSCWAQLAWAPDQGEHSDA